MSQIINGIDERMKKMLQPVFRPGRLFPAPAHVFPPFHYRPVSASFALRSFPLYTGIYIFCQTMFFSADFVKYSGIHDPTEERKDARSGPDPNGGRNFRRKKGL
jgi:hypothetical protein